MTQWVENPEGGRDRGPVALARAWVEVLVRPRRFFRAAVAPGDQAPGLVFAIVVVLAHLGVRFALAPDSVPGLTGGWVASALFVAAVAALIVAPAVLHLAAAVETLALVALVDDRAGVSETVQVVGYASAPCVFAGVPVAEVRLLACAYGAALLVVGTAVVHRTSLPRAAGAAAVPALLVFGYGFGGLAALAAATGWEFGAPGDAAGT